MTMKKEKRERGSLFGIPVEYVTDSNDKPKKKRRKRQNFGKLSPVKFDDK